MFSATSWLVAVICRMLEALSSVHDDSASTRSLIDCKEIAIDLIARAVSSTATICSPRPLESSLTFSPMTPSTSSISLLIVRIWASTASTSIDAGRPDTMINESDESKNRRDHTRDRGCVRPPQHAQGDPDRADDERERKAHEARN